MIIDHPIHPINWFKNIPHPFFAIQDMGTLDKSRTRASPEIGVRTLLVNFVMNTPRIYPASLW